MHPEASVREAGITWLDVPADAGAYAQRHGARWHRTERSWFCYDPVPAELVNFLPRQRLPRAVPEGAYGCPVCGSTMVRRISRYCDSVFWACSTWPLTGCDGKRSEDEEWGLSASSIQHALEWAAGDALSTLRQKTPHEKPSATTFSHLLQDPEVIALLKAVLIETGASSAALRWLKAPKRALKFERPLDVIHEINGRKALWRLLDELNK